MRYNEPKDASAALLRMALQEMTRHDAALNPVTYAVWYEHLAGINLRLSEAMRRCMDGAQRLTDDLVRELYSRHVAELDQSTADRVTGELRTVMQKIADSASRTGQEAGAFGQSLDGLSVALQSSDGDALVPHVDRTLARTQAMREAVEMLQRQLDDSGRQIEQLRADLQRIREEALTDPLSGVLNRKGFDQRLAEVLATRPPAGAVHCLMLLDLDHFKRVNDTHGHLVGDTVIRMLGQLLKRHAAEPGITCARYGGEEFAVLMASTTLARAQALAETLRQLTRAMKVRHRTTQEVLLTVTLSAGVAAWIAGEDAASLVASADAALYRSKENGRDRVTVA